MLSLQPQAFAPARSLAARPSAIASALALAGVAPLSQAAFFAGGFVFWYWEHRRERARETLRVQAEG